jgi:hypothetical protein
VDTIGSGFDTVIAVYVNNPTNVQTVTNLAWVVSDDDGAGYPWSRTNFNAVAGVSYQIAVDGYGSADAGTIVFHLHLPNPNPVITNQPQSQVVNAGASAVFLVGAGGPGPLRFQWRREGTNLPGATAATLVVNNAQAADEGVYTVVVTNNAGAVTSAPVTLTVRTPPQIAAHPASVVVDVGADVSFSVGASGTAPLSYQWRWNGTNLPGETGTSLTRANVQFTDGGVYSVAVANSAGSVNSLGAALIVRPVFLAAQGPSNGVVVLVFRGTPGQRYAVEGSTNLVDWPAVGAVTNEAVEAQFPDASATNSDRRVYRLRVEW